MVSRTKHQKKAASAGRRKQSPFRLPHVGAPEHDCGDLEPILKDVESEESVVIHCQAPLAKGKVPDVEGRTSRRRGSSRAALSKRFDRCGMGAGGADDPPAKRGGRPREVDL